jgi:hypothetical protein
MEEIGKASWSLFQHDSVAAFKLSEKSPLPPAVCTKDISGGWTQMFNVSQIWRMNHHPVETDQDSTPDSITDTEN